jgi:hypothetical protein
MQDKLSKLVAIFDGLDFGANRACTAAEELPNTPRSIILLSSVASHTEDCLQFMPSSRMAATEAALGRRFSIRFLPRHGDSDTLKAHSSNAFKPL